MSHSNFVHPAPICLFVYNRLNHTQKTIEALIRNILADDSELFIFSDGPKGDFDKSSVDEVRKYIKNVSGFKRITIVEREKNWGLGNNIIDGVTNIVTRYGSIIVMEDDLVTSPHFLEFMNEALDMYRGDERVMLISGFTPPIKKKGLPETFFASWPDNLGWGTWDRCWKYFEKNPEKMIKEYTEDEIYYLNFNGNAPDMWQQVIDNYNGVINTWAIFYAAAICKRKGLTLYSRESLLQNIGMDGSGEHSGITDVLDVSLCEHKVNISRSEIKNNSQADVYFEEHRKNIRRPKPLPIRAWKILKRDGLKGILNKFVAIINKDK